MGKKEITPIEVQKYLKGISYPASKEDLIKHAEKNKAGNDIITWLKEIKKSKFDNPAEVSKELGKSE